MTGKAYFFSILIMIATNGLWYCITQQKSIGETPMIILPFISAVFVVVILAREIVNNWDY